LAIAVCALLMSGGVAAVAQQIIPAAWIGTWVFDAESSTGVGIQTLVPGDAKFRRMTMKIAQDEGVIRIESETTYEDDSGGAHSSPEDMRFALDGKPASMGPISLSFRRVDDTTFETVSRSGNRNLEQVGRFAFSADGTTLTVTKIMVSIDAAGQSTSRTAPFEMVFRKSPK
jgi:hypothetical protein